MATIKATRVDTPYDGTILLYKWENLTENDVGEPLALPDRADKSVQFIGNFGGGQIDFEGSNVPQSEDNADHDTLKDAFENPIEAIAEGTFGVAEATYQTRPRPVSGTGMSVTVHLLAIRTTE